MDTQPKPWDERYRTAYVVIAVTGVLALLCLTLTVLAQEGFLGDSNLARFTTPATGIFWAVSVFVAVFVAAVQERWQWVVVLLLAPFLQIVFVIVPFIEARETRRHPPLDYTSPEVRAAAEAEHSSTGSYRRQV